MEVLHLNLLKENDTLFNKPIYSTMGVFDGVHIGHDQLIQRTRALAKTNGGLSCVITFIDNPGQILDPGQYMGSITTLKQKIELFGHHGVDVVLLIPFDESLRHTPAEQFMEKLIRLLPMNSFSVGENFRLGKHPGMSAFELSKKFSWVDILPLTYHNNQPISSTRIRKAVYRGALDEVSELLNRLFVVDLCGIPILRHRDKTQIYRDMVSQVLPHSGAHCVTLRYCSGEQIERTVNCEDSSLSWEGHDPEGQISGIQFSLNTK